MTQFTQHLHRCTCCRHVRVWPLLPLVGVVTYEPETLELRNCDRCGSTLSRVVAVGERRAA